MTISTITTSTRLLLVLAASAATLSGCIQREPSVPTPLPPRPAPVMSEAGVANSGLYQINHAVTIDGVGSAQGIFAEGDFIYVLGDLNAREPDEHGPGVIREFFRSTGDNGRATLRSSGRQIMLTESGRDVAPHPTSLTWHPNFGYWLGSTMDERGTLLQIDFARAIRQGNLDGCVLHEVIDDAAISGTRPMFVTLPGGRVVLATSDDGDQSNALRLYDPLALLAVDRTSTIGVIFSETACGPFVQSLASRGNTGELWLVQNRTDGMGHRLTAITLNEQGAIASESVIGFDQPTTELKGLLWLEPNRNDQTPFISVSSQPDANVQFGRQLPPERFVNPVQRQLNR